ncbi:MAG: TldD/PmbA family protein [Candidatus Zixiibacteriota bacterium]
MFSKKNVLICILLFISIQLAASESQLLNIIETELENSVSELKYSDKSELYYLSYGITGYHRISLSYELGTLSRENDYRERILDIDLRVGDYHRDNTHELREKYGGSSYYRGIGRVDIPINDDKEAIKDAIWLATDEAYKDAIDKYQKVLRNTKVKVEADDTSSDFSKIQPSIHLEEPVDVELDKEKWHGILQDLSSKMKENPDVYSGNVNLRLTSKNSYFVNSEGTKIQQSNKFLTLSIYMNTIAEDGMELYRSKNFSSGRLDDLPSPEALGDTISRLMTELTELRNAEMVEPYSGPAILMSRASGVFFHEIFGHRIEGHRQKSVNDGQTFSDKVGESILPEFLSIYDDPTIDRFNGEGLRGYFKYDDEGTKARRVDVVKNGTLNEFLMSRSPIENFPESNGHARRQPGNRAVSRQGNLFIHSDKEMSYENLRQKLKDEIKEQDKPFGLLFADISGGFTMTGRYGPQSFKVQPLMVYKVYADDRPDELVRGVDIVGTPLTSFSKIIATADDYGIFNGSCGAESGMIPVSAISPSILVSQIEVEKKMKGQDRPPILSPPAKGVN